jgi:hypothetical protein
VTTEESHALRALAEQCRGLAKGVSSPEVAASLKLMAEDYERKAAEVEARQPAPSPPPTPLA